VTAVTQSDIRPRALSVSQAIIYGGLLAAALDIMDPIIFYGMQGVAPVRIMQSVAAGLLGKEAARAGGWSTGLLGLGLHVAIMLVIAAIYVLASRRLPMLARRWQVWGPLYGVGVYFVMSYIVVPLSAAHGKPPAGWGPVLSQLFAMVVLVGVTIAFFASRVGPRSSARM
jgi:uncharacterized membrane protein YagU involved in acid resistance